VRGIVCESVNKLAFCHLDEPVRKEGEAIVRIKRIGICGTDMHAYRGRQPYFTYPRILGHELAGVIEYTEDNPYGLRNGDQVAVIPYLVCGHCVACRSGKTNCCVDMKVMGVHIDGGMREFISVPLANLIKDDRLSLDELAVLEPLSIGTHAVRRSMGHPGEHVLVIGAGPIGLGVMMAAKYRGCQVIAMDIHKDRLQFSRDWANADHVIDAKHPILEQLRTITNGDLPTLVFDATGNVASMQDSFQYVAHGGKLVFVGLVKADIRFSSPEFHKREMSLLSSRNAAAEDFETTISMITSGAADIQQYITHRSSFAQMIDQFESWLKPEANVMKAIVDVDSN